MRSSDYSENDELPTNNLPPLPKAPDKPSAGEMLDVFALLHSDKQTWQQVMRSAEKEQSDDNFLYFEKVMGLVALLNDQNSRDEDIKSAFEKLWQSHIESNSASFEQSNDEKPINISANNRAGLTELFKMVTQSNNIDRKTLKDGLLHSLQHPQDQRTILDYMLNGRNGKIDDPVLSSIITDGLREVRTKGPVLDSNAQADALQFAVNSHKQYADHNRTSKDSREKAAEKFRDILINEKYSDKVKAEACQFLRQHHMFTRDAKLGSILKVTEQLLIKNGVDYKTPKAGEKFFNKISAAAHDLTRGVKKVADKLTDKNPENERKNEGMRRR